MWWYVWSLQWRTCLRCDVGLGLWRLGTVVTASRYDWCCSLTLTVYSKYQTGVMSTQPLVTRRSTEVFLLGWRTCVQSVIRCVFSAVTVCFRQWTKWCWHHLGEYFQQLFEWMAESCIGVRFTQLCGMTIFEHKYFTSICVWCAVGYLTTALPDVYC